MSVLANPFAHAALAVALGFLIGLSLGLLGGGGSILTVPVFVYVLGFGAKESIAMSLAVVGATSLVGAVMHRRHGHVNLRIAAVFGAVAVVGAFAGTRIARHLTGREQLTIFAVVMLVAAVVMLRGRRGEGMGASTRGLGSIVFTGTQGLVVGMLTGLVGVGGGFLIVPALVWGRLAMPEAVGTSLVVITLNSAVSLLGYLGQVQIAWLSVALVTAGTMPGIASGTYAMRFVSQPALRRGFALLLFFLSGFMLYRNL
jgi:uncharacterized membrane protein YfcA